MKTELKEEAKQMRRDGYSTREIAQALSMARSTISLWVRSEKMSGDGRKRFNNLLVSSRLKAQRVLLDKNRKYLGELDSRCQVLKNGRKYSKDDLKAFLALLYWGEGTKSGRSFYFTNSDAGMISVYLKLLRSAFVIKEDKLYAWLHLHAYHDRAEMLRYWSKITGIDKNRIHIYNKENSGPRKKEGYKGCICVRYNDYRLFDEVMIIIKRFVSLKV